MNNMSNHLGLTSNEKSLNCSEKLISFQSNGGFQRVTTPRFVSFGPFCVEDSNMKGTKRKRKDTDGGTATGRDPLLLSLRCSPNKSESNKRRSLEAMSIVSSANEADEECSVNLDLNSQHGFDPKNLHIPKTHAAFNLELSLSVGRSVSAITSEVGIPAQTSINRETLTVNFHDLLIDDGPVSSIRGNGNSLIPSIRKVPKYPVDRTSGIIRKQNHSSSAKKCLFPGCQKRARGASAHCITHGGGKICQKPDCKRQAEGKTIYCKSHGGGRGCAWLGCLKCAEGSTDFCIPHGGGRRCSEVDCTTASRGKSGLCIKHGGGRRCEKENCNKSADGRSGLCIAHGGGRRCHHEECTKSAQGGTMFCKAHGGGKRCSYEHCGKSAEGRTLFCKRHGGGKRCLFDKCSKSVHGGTQFCVAHGGGKRCADPQCTKSARGRSDHCARHGGGRRCQFEGCDKGAQGSTNFCKAHGCDRRCSCWGSSCDQFCTGKVGLCTAHSALVRDHRVPGGNTMGTPVAPEKLKAISVEESGLVGRSALDQMKLIRPIVPVKSGEVSLPEGRVRGGFAC